jgi:hypothetical protein
MNNAIYPIEIELSNGETVRFFPAPLDRPYDCLKGKWVADDLANILEDPADYKELAPKKDAIFLGFGSDQPGSTYRCPVWLPTEWLTTHLFIGGATGSGKTSLTYRLIAGTLQKFGSVVIGEVKSGTGGSAPGAAFTEISTYLRQRLNIATYRWPRGNCWFNPLLYLNTKDSRNSLMQTVVQQVQFSGEMQGYVAKAAEIAGLILEYLQMPQDPNIKKQRCTLRQLVRFLRNYQELETELRQVIDVNKQKPKLDRRGKQYLQRLEEIYREFNSPEGLFNVEKNKLISTANAIKAIAALLDDEDLLYYSEFHEKDRHGNPLRELKIDDILYEKSLMVVSQPNPESKPSSKIVGPLFWDSLLSRVLEIGIGLPKNASGKKREKVAVFLDETHRLEVGSLGNAGDFVRQFDVALIEIAPAIKDMIRWEESKAVYQTFLSLSPAIAPLADLIYQWLPNQPEDLINIKLNRVDGSTTVGWDINPNYVNPGSRDNPGVTPRSLLNTGDRTGLLMNRGIPGVFWIDFDSPLLAEFTPELDCSLLKDAISPNASAAAKAAIDYALGLVTEFPDFE